VHDTGGLDTAKPARCQPKTGRRTPFGPCTTVAGSKQKEGSPLGEPSVIAYLGRVLIQGTHLTQEPTLPKRRSAKAMAPPRPMISNRPAGPVGDGTTGIGGRVLVGGAVLVGVAVGVNVGVCVGVAVGVDVGVCVGVCVGVSVGVAVALTVGVCVGVKVGVSVGVSVGVCVGVSVAVIVGVKVGVGVASMFNEAVFV